MKRTRSSSKGSSVPVFDPSTMGMYRPWIEDPDEEETPKTAEQRKARAELAMASVRGVLHRKDPK